jgi:hypothetical protein
MRSKQFFGPLIQINYTDRLVKPFFRQFLFDGLQIEQFRNFISSSAIRPLILNRKSGLHINAVQLLERNHFQFIVIHKQCVHQSGQCMVYTPSDHACPTQKPWQVVESMSTMLPVRKHN